MRPRGRRGGLAIAGWLLIIGSPLAGQPEGTVDLGASVVKYDGFLTSGALVFAPALRFDNARWSVAGRGSFTLFESGREVLQGNLAAAWLAGSSGSWRLELSGSAGASEYADQTFAGHLLAGARLHVLAGGSGGWIGANTGRSFGDLEGAPVELVVAGWSVRNRLALVGSATSAWLGPARQVDLVGAVRWTGPGMELEARAGVRPWARDAGNLNPFTGVYGEIAAVVRLKRWLAVSLGGGKDPSDPVRGILGASYLSAGFRLRSFGRTAPTMPVRTTGVLRGRRVPTEESGPALEIVGSAERRTLRVRAPDAMSVELMGDFTDWVPVRLARVAPGVWEISLAVTAGVHRVNIRLDGRPWSAPGGARLEQTEFGGTVGIVVVP